MHTCAHTCMRTFIHHAHKITQKPTYTHNTGGAVRDCHWWAILPLPRKPTHSPCVCWSERLSDHAPPTPTHPQLVCGAVPAGACGGSQSAKISFNGRTAPSSVDLMEKKRKKRYSFTDIARLKCFTYLQFPRSLNTCLCGKSAQRGQKIHDKKKRIVLKNAFTSWQFVQNTLMQYVLRFWVLK